MRESQHLPGETIVPGSRHRTLIHHGLLAALIAALLGCGRGEPVRHYRVPKREVLYAENHVAKSAESKAEPALVANPTDRLLGAIVPHGAQTWYFKMVGPMDAVASQGAAFRSLIESLRFENDQGLPQWTLPESWQEKPKSGEKVATLSVEADGKTLEISVIPLATDSAPSSVLDNINRWRAQMQLAPIATDQLAAEITLLNLPVGQATLVNLVGNFRSGGMAGTARQLGSSAPAKEKESEPAGDVPRYEKPDNWVAAATDAFSQQAFSVSDGAASARVTISRLQGDGGGLLENTNRWRRQVGLPDFAEPDLATQAEEFPIDGTRGVYLENVGANGQGQPEAVFGWIGRQQDQSWFIKIRGDAKLVGDQRETFRTFLKSLKLTASNGVGDGN